MIKKQKLHDNDMLNNQMQYCEIRNCSSEPNKDEAYGPDLIHNQMIMNGGPTLWNQLPILFNKCLKQGILPKIWNYANIHSMPKPKKDHFNPKNSRPMTVSSC